jgi:hypothetical protein
VDVKEYATKVDLRKEDNKSLLIWFR